MTLRYLLDTSVVSAPIAKMPMQPVVERLRLVEQNCAIAAPVWHELTYGWERMPLGRRRTVIEAYASEVVLRSFPILPYDAAAAKEHASQRVQLESLGKTAPFVDGQIAAIAIVNELVLVTLNPKDFVRFNGLRFEDWRRRG